MQGVGRLTNNHSWTREEWLGGSNVSNLARGTTQLGIQLHANVGAVLRRRLFDMGGVHHLRDQAPSTLHVLLKTLILE